MQSVLISIRPEWCAKIASGEKTIEVRKTAPKIPTPFKCYIYCTLNGSNELFKDVLGGDIAAWNRGKWGEKKGNVIGEFVCDNVFLWNHDIHDEDTITLEEASELSCLSEDALLKYADGYFYGWHISDLVIYEKPKELSEFKPWHRECLYSDLGLAIPDCWECRSCKVKRPPQSWCYVED